jgi:hypothetical protein
MKDVMKDEHKDKEEEDSTISYFIEDANLFALWFLSNPGFHPSEGYFGMGELLMRCMTRSYENIKNGKAKS